MQNKTFEVMPHGPCILGTVADIPTQEWLDIQIKTPPEGGIWYSAYPLSGGAILVHETEIVNKRLTTLSDINTLVSDNGFNPAATIVLEMFGLMLK